MRPPSLDSSEAIRVATRGFTVMGREAGGDELPEAQPASANPAPAAMIPRRVCI